jgi:ferritin-like protein
MSSRLTRHLSFGSVPPTTRTDVKTFVPSGPAGQREGLTIHFLATPREHAIYLLHVGAEVEHALLVQYLFAAYSLGGPQIKEPSNQQKAQEWRQTIASIAQQEMGHLVAVENLLQLIGGPLSFERQDFPSPSDLYPFPFALKPLTRQTLAQYVLAEMPDDEVIKELGLTERVDKVKKAAGGNTESTKVNRVGVIYDAITKLFTIPDQGPDPTTKKPTFIASADIQSNSLDYQARFAEWGLGDKGILVKAARDRGEALEILKAVSEQGEGSDVKDLESSHFWRFLKIFEVFPEHGEWTPARDVAENPSTLPGDGLSEITNCYALEWAKLANVRYRMSLMFLLHSFSIRGPVLPGARSPRGLLISWSFGEMYNLRSMSDILVSLALADPSDGRFAGTPFELPYTLSLADREPDRWRLHRDLMMVSQEHITNLLEHKVEAHREYLLGLASANQRALLQTEPLIGA